MSDFREAGIEVKRVINGMKSSIQKQAKSRGLRASIEVRDKAIDFLGGQRHGRRYRNPATKQMYTASAPGEAPAARLGHFRESFKDRPYITESNGNLTIYARAASKMKAGEEKNGKKKGKEHLLGNILEYGTKKIKPRPYKDRIIQLALPEVLRIFNEPYVR